MALIMYQEIEFLFSDKLFATFRFLEFFCLFPIFSAQTCLFLNQKWKKICMSVFSTHFVLLISILAPNIMEE